MFLRKSINLSIALLMVFSIFTGTALAKESAPGTPSPTGMDLIVDPGALTATLIPDATQVAFLDINNPGTTDVDWLIYEPWADDFDAYALDTSIHGQGGWKGWFNDPTYTAYVRDDYAHSAPHSVEVVGETDLVREFSGYTSGVWEVTAWQYIPSGGSGQTYFIMLNQYNDAGAPLNWSTQVMFDMGTNTVSDTGAAGGSLPLIYDEWVEIRVVIDLGANTQTFYYGENQLYTGSWTENVSGGGTLNIAAMDLFANGASAVYYDDISLGEPGTAQCSEISEIGWLAVDPVFGTIEPSGTDTVEVTFDSTGLELGDYDAIMCVKSDDPGTPLIPVPVMLSVVEHPDIAVDPMVLEAVAYPESTVDELLGITNNGQLDLEWLVYEDAADAKLVDWADDFESYAVDTPLHGQGGWKAWANDPSATGYVRDEYAYSGNNSVEIVDLNDMVHEFTGYTSGIWEVRAQQYIPSAGKDGIAYFILLNQYSDAGANNWSTQIAFDFDTNTLSVDEDLANTTLPIIYDEWVELLVVIDLDNNLQTIYYDGQQLVVLPWVRTGSGGIANIAAIDLWGNEGTSVYYDDISLAEPYSGPCSETVDIPWLSADPTAGTTISGATDLVTVTFDSTGLALGSYNGTVCVASNDPDTPFVPVPVSLTVIPEPDIVVDPLALAETLLEGETAEVVFNIANQGEGTLDFTVTADPAVDWLAFDVADGSLAEAEDQDVTVTFDSTGLDEGVYETSLLVASNDPDTPEAVVDVTLTVVAPAISVDTTAIAITLAAGQTSEVDVVLKNEGTADLHIFDITGMQSWLTVPFTQTTILPGATEPLTLTVDTADLAVGTYTATLQIASDCVYTPIVTLDVALTVTEAPVVEFSYYIPVVLTAKP